MNIYRLGLTPLFKEAKEKGLWFFSNYQQLWFSPKQLREHISNNRFQWGAVNWKLRNPQEMVDQAEKELQAAKKHLEEIRKMLQ